MHVGGTAYLKFSIGAAAQQPCGIEHNSTIKMQFRARVTAAATLGLVAVATAQSIVAVPWPTPSKIPLNITLGYGTVNSTGTRFNWYIAVLDDLSRFSVQLPTGGCRVRSTTTTTSNLYTCSAAVNAGFFSFSPNVNGSYCMGELVVNGSIEAWDGDGDAMLSVTADNTTLIGALTTEQVRPRGCISGILLAGLVGHRSSSLAPMPRLDVYTCRSSP